MDGGYTCVFSPFSQPLFSGFVTRCAAKGRLHGVRSMAAPVLFMKRMVDDYSNSHLVVFLPFVLIWFGLVRSD